uniref:Uncharacterized protein n=1 Tax=Steinernema glaseri TaxID=37863 RepID=A0A1I8AAG5_9BILA
MALQTTVDAPPSRLPSVRSGDVDDILVRCAAITPPRTAPFANGTKVQILGLRHSAEDRCFPRSEAGQGGAPNVNGWHSSNSFAMQMCSLRETCEWRTVVARLIAGNRFFKHKLP